MKNFFLIIILLLLKTASQAQEVKADFNIKISNESAVTIQVNFADSVYSIKSGKNFDLKRKLNPGELSAYLSIYSPSNRPNFTGPDGTVYKNDTYLKTIRLYWKSGGTVRQIVIDRNKKVLFTSSDMSEKKMEYYESNVYKRPFWLFTDSVLNKNWNDISGADIIYIYLCKNKNSVSKIQSYYDRLSPDIKSSFAGKRIFDYMEGRKRLSIGNYLKNFTLIDSNRKEISLYNIKSEFILLDFWFSSCGPWIASIPEKVSFYKKVNKEKIQIVGISVDPLERFNNWKSSIRSNNLSWINLIDFTSSIPFKTYAITVYPTTILLNSEHEIIMINPTIAEINKILK